MKKRNEIFEVVDFWHKKHIKCKFRVDPVPHIGSNRFAQNFRRPKSTNEKRQWDPEYGRLKRSPSLLPDEYDDKYRSGSKSWKSKKKQKQWM